jgi:tRNA dimethylallyltransferase
MKEQYLISIVGATAIGKTALSIALAKHFNTEIISSDSRQFYKEMNIGTAVPSSEELNQVKHHFIQNRSIFEDYNVGDFERDVLLKLDTLFKKKKVIIMVGGSGLYVNAVLEGLDDFPEVDSNIRMQLKLDLKEKGIKFLQEQLKEIDYETFQKIELENPQRIIRALEICIGTKKPYSSFLNAKKENRNFNVIKIGLKAPREIIYDRINQRVDIMVATGLLEEAEKLYPHKDLNALQTVGYRELFSYFEEKFTLDFAIAEIKKNTRRFAKRQGTWFKKDLEIEWFDFQDKVENIISYIEKKMQEESIG